MPWMNKMWAGMTWMWIFPVLFLVGLAFFLTVLSKGVGGFQCGTPGNREKRALSGETAIEMLDRRYARGEITREQYLKMRKDLE